MADRLQQIPANEEMQYVCLHAILNSWLLKLVLNPALGCVNIDHPYAANNKIHVCI